MDKNFASCTVYWMRAYLVPREYLFRKLHSLMGLWFFIFLLEHLFTNSQIFLFFLNDDTSFVRMVNLLVSVPYLHLIELFLLAVPITYHTILGVYYMVSTRNKMVRRYSLSYANGIAFKLHRVTAWILLVGVFLHVVHMRIINYPIKTFENGKSRFYEGFNGDVAFYKTALSLGATIHDKSDLEQYRAEIDRLSDKIKPKYNNNISEDISRANISIDLEGRKARLAAIEEALIDHNVVVSTDSFGVIELLVVRDAFQSLWISILYTIFFLSAVFHGANGFWTFLISWGMILSAAAHRRFRFISLFLGLLLVLFGTLSVWAHIG